MPVHLSHQSMMCSAISDDGFKWCRISSGRADRGSVTPIPAIGRVDLGTNRQTRSQDVDLEFASLVAGLTRRGLLGSGIGAAAWAGIAGCSSAPASSVQSATTRQIKTAKGVVEVPVEPKRIVSINQFDTTVLYDLGIEPVGVFDYGIDYTSPRYRDRYAAAPKIGKSGIEVEKIAALQPDLILGYDIEFNTAVSDQLSKLAPTVIVTNTSWQDTAQAIADAIGRGDAYEALKAKYRQRCDQLRETYAELLTSTRWNVLQGGFDQGACWIFGPQAGVVAVLTDAGVRLAPASQKVSGSVYKPLSYENLSDLSDADVIAYWSEYETTTPVNNGPQLFAQPLWRSLPAVQKDWLVPIADVPLSGYGDALAALDELESGLKKIKESR